MAILVAESVDPRKADREWHFPDDADISMDRGVIAVSAPENPGTHNEPCLLFLSLSEYNPVYVVAE